MTSAARPIAIAPVPLLNDAARALAWALSKVTRVERAGVFLVRGSTPFVDAWREPGSFTLRIGLVEVIVDLRD